MSDNEMTSQETSKKAEPKKEKSPKNKAPQKSFFKGLKAEFAKIIWPNKTDITRETTAVVMMSAVLGVIIYIADALFKAGIFFISQ